MDNLALVKNLIPAVTMIESAFPGTPGADKSAMLMAILSAFIPPDQLAKVQGIINLIVMFANMFGVFKSGGAVAQPAPIVPVAPTADALISNLFKPQPGVTVQPSQSFDIFNSSLGQQPQVMTPVPPAPQPLPQQIAEAAQARGPFP